MRNSNWLTSDGEIIVEQHASKKALSYLLPVGRNAADRAGSTHRRRANFADEGTRHRSRGLLRNRFDEGGRLSMRVVTSARLGFAIILAALGLAPAAWAQSYPSKVVRYVVPFPAGASPDIIARLLTDRFSRMWGQQVIVENRSGAGGTVGAAYAAKSPPDGYTLFQCNIASSAIAESLYAKMPYEQQRDFAPISRIGTSPSVLVVHPSMPARSLQEFIAYARQNPGKLSYGTSAAGTSPQLAMELIKLTAKIDVVHVAYK